MRSRKPGGSHRRWIVARFALTSLLVFTLIGLAISYLRTRDVRARAESSATALAVVVAQDVVTPALQRDPGLLSGPMTGAGYRRVDDIVQRIVGKGEDIKRVKIWGTDGTVLYSNDPAEIGVHSNEDDLGEAIEGGTESDIDDLTKPENQGERGLGSKLFETYVPVRLTTGGPVVGVVEVYRDYGVIQAEIDEMGRTLKISLGLGLLVMYALLLPLMIGTNKTLRRQNEQLTEQASQLSDLLEREQATVAELRELDRMKDDFVSASSHELRSPLTSILGYARMMRAGAADNPIAIEAVDAIERQGNRMLRLVMNLLTESRIESGRSESPVTAFDVSALLREVAGDFHLDGDRVRLEVDDELEARCDRSRVADVLVNLMDNALKYAEPGTPVRVRAAVADDTLTLSVHDEGKGIEPEDLPRIFERFYQADQSVTRMHGGVGLGLHIVKGLVDGMGGHVTVQSEPGAGTTFTVTIPMVVMNEPTPSQYSPV